MSSPRKSKVCVVARTAIVVVSTATLVAVAPTSLKASASTEWVQVGGDIDGEAAADQSGESVSMSADGSRVAIGVRRNNGANGTNSGHVRVYELVNSAWVQVGGDIDGEASDDNSGTSVSLSADGSRVAIGAIWNDGNGADSGHVRVYELVNSAWVQVGGDIDGEASDDYSGKSVSLSADGSRVAIGAVGNDGNGTNSGHVRVYELVNSAWVQVGGDINGEAMFDQSGWSVSLSADGSRVAIGAMRNHGNGAESGHVRVYELVNSAWVQVGADIDGEASNDNSGTSVSLSADGSRVAIGARGNDGNGTNSGHVRVYELVNSAWVQVGADINGEAAGDQLGAAVSLSADGSRVAAGAVMNMGVNGADSGHVRVFSYGVPRSPDPGSSPAPVARVPAVVTPAALAAAPAVVSYRALNKKVTVRWGAVPGATSYVVTTAAGVVRCTAATTSCELSGLRNGKAYTYLVYAVNADGVRSSEATRVSVRAGFQVKKTSLKARRSLALSSIVTTPSKGTKSWRVTSGKCRIQGSRLVAPATKGTCKLRLATAKRGTYAAMSTTITITVTR